MRLRMVGVAFALVVATAARAQQDQAQQDRGGGAQGAGGQGQGASGGQAQGGQGARSAAPQRPRSDGQTVAVGPSSDAFDRACIDLMHGRMPEGERAIKSLRDACANLMSGRVDERLDAERRRQEQIQARQQLQAVARGEAQPGQSSAQPQQGQGVLAAFGQAGSELVGGQRSKALGMRARGPVSYMLVTNPVGWFSGLGINAELFGVFQDAPKFSWVAGARYSATDATNGTASTFGAEAGADFFIIGQHNEGLRLGPRVEVAAGRERFQGSTTFARMGLGGELGYNFIATNGITGMAAVGLGGRVAGDSKNDSFASFVGGEFGPYAKLGIGFSW
jgi:hypothetical protein